MIICWTEAVWKGIHSAGHSVGNGWIINQDHWLGHGGSVIAFYLLLQTLTSRAVGFNKSAVSANGHKACDQIPDPIQPQCNCHNIFLSYIKTANIILTFLLLSLLILVRSHKWHMGATPHVIGSAWSWRSLEETGKPGFLSGLVWACCDRLMALDCEQGGPGLLLALHMPTQTNHNTLAMRRKAQASSWAISLPYSSKNNPCWQYFNLHTTPSRGSRNTVGRRVFRHSSLVLAFERNSERWVKSGSDL